MSEIVEKIIIAAALVVVLVYLMSGPDIPTGYTGSLWEEVQHVGYGC